MKGWLLVAAGCAGEAPCARLHDALASCDLAPASDTCGEVSPGVQRALLAQIDAEGCAGLYGPDRTVLPSACEAFGWDCPPPLYAGAPAHPAHPVVLVSGIDDAPAFDWSPEVVDAVDAVAEAHHVTLPGWETREVRARALWDALQALPGERLNLVCYAVGGLDCRYLASPGGLFVDDPAAYGAVARKIGSITTLATPHRGTNVADALLAAPPGEWTDLVGSALLGPDGGSEDERQARLEAVLQELTLTAGRTFAEQVVDAPGVAYRSYAGVSRAFDQDLLPSEVEIRDACTSLGQVRYLHYEGGHDRMSDVLWPLAGFAEVQAGASGLRTTGPADGMVAVESAAWTGFAGCLPADHYDVIGRLEEHGADPRTGFDAAGFAQHVVGALAEEGL
ncbi:MAG: hypothetical protein R3F59_26790 [Myxococcota bacterium]